MSLVPKISGDLILTAVSAPDLVNEIMVGDAQVSEPNLQGHSECNRIFKGGLSAIPGLIPPFPDEGIILSSGSATGIIDQGGSNTNWESPGDPDVTDLIGQETYDACVLEFDFVCSETDDVSFSVDYVFGSEEYPRYQGYNDGFGFFLNGKNVAVVPGTNSAVSIISINENQHAEYYVDNPLVSSPYPKFEANGFTKTMKAIGTATAGSNSIKLAIADGLDGQFDSWVLIKGTSFTCTIESENPSVVPSDQPSKSSGPSISLSSMPSSVPSTRPSLVPSGNPSTDPSSGPSALPSMLPSLAPSVMPSSKPSDDPSASPSSMPSLVPSTRPSLVPSGNPSTDPSSGPSASPSSQPSIKKQNKKSKKKLKSSKV